MATIKTKILEPRYDHVREAAKAYLAENNIELPLNLESLIESNTRRVKWEFKTLTELSSATGEDANFIRKNILGGGDGAAMTDGESFVICYDDTVRCKERMRWTIAHEIGHVLLHHFDFGFSCLNRANNPTYKAFEQEADAFAAVLLAPFAILKEVDPQSPEEVAELCKLSKTASRYRYESYRNWKKYGKLTKLDKIISEKYIRASRSAGFRNKCPECNIPLPPWAEYCYECGSHPSANRFKIPSPINLSPGIMLIGCFLTASLPNICH